MPIPSDPPSHPAPALHPEFIIPAGVRHDGEQRCRHLGVLQCFTDLETGASFSLRHDEITSTALAAITADVRRRFRTPAPVEAMDVVVAFAQGAGSPLFPPREERTADDCPLHLRQTNFIRPNPEDYAR